LLQLDARLLFVFGVLISKKFEELKPLERDFSSDLLKTSGVNYSAVSSADREIRIGQNNIVRPCSVLSNKLATNNDVTLAFRIGPL